MSFECYHEYEAIYLKTSSLDPQKDVSLQQMALLSPGQWLAVGPKLMGREIILCVSYCSKPGGGCGGGMGRVSGRSRITRWAEGQLVHGL